MDKQELSSAVVLNLRTHKSLVVFDRTHEHVDHRVIGDYGSAQIGGRWYGYFGGFTLEEMVGVVDEGYANEARISDGVMAIIPDLYRVDLETGALLKVATGDLGTVRWLIGPQGDIVARELYDDRTGNWKIKVGGFAGRVIASGQDKFQSEALLGLGRTPDSILISRDDGDRLLTEEWPLSGGPAKPAFDDRSDESLIQDPTTGLWIGTMADGDETTPSLFSPALEAKVRGALRAFPGYRASLKSWNSDFSRMIVFTDGGDDSGTYWFVDIAKKSAVPLGAAYPTVTPAEVGPVRMVDWKAADGLALHGVLTLPPGRPAKNLPLVVMPHGGPGARDYPEFNYRAQAFASRGYAVFQPNFRGSTGYDDALFQAGYGEWGRKMQTDISDGVAELARQGVIDPKRVASLRQLWRLCGACWRHGAAWPLSLRRLHGRNS